MSASQDKSNDWPTVLLTKRLIGQILLDGGFVSRADIDRALDEQCSTNEPLGEILVRNNALARRELNAVLAVQKYLTTFKDALNVVAGNPWRLGEFLVNAGRISSTDLEDALREQKVTSEKIGQILQKRGLITAAELDAALEFQRRQSEVKAETEAAECCRLGGILVADGLITSDQLRDALAAQKDTGRRVGELLVEAGHVEPHHVEHALGIQKKLVAAVFAAALSLYAAAMSSPAEAAGMGRHSNSAKIGVTAYVTSYAKINVISQAREVVVTHADAIRGYVDVPAASIIEVKSNNRSGYMMTFAGQPGPFQEVEVIKDSGSPIRISLDGGSIFQANSSNSTMTMHLGYRFILAKGAQPGTYAWPLSMTVSAVPS